MIDLANLELPFVIAEIGGNHEGDIDYAFRLLDQAVNSGAHAVKFQTYSPDRIVSKVKSPDRHAHFGKFALETGQYVELAKECKSRNVEFMTSIWDLESFSTLDPFIEVHKVGSGDLTNYRLIKVFAETGKPLCIATAMSNMDEVKRTVDFVDSVAPGLIDAGKLCVMHCVAMYGDPRDEHANLGAIKTLQDELAPEIVCGYSDHTIGTTALKTAVAMGAKVLEMHFTDDPSREFRDHHFSQTEASVKDLIDYCKRYTTLMGTGSKSPVSAVETPERVQQFRRSVVFAVDMKAGQVADESNLTTLRPFSGICATEYFDVVGKKLAKDKQAFEQVDWSDFV